MDTDLRAAGRQMTAGLPEPDFNSEAAQSVDSSSSASTSTLACSSAKWVASLIIQSVDDLRSSFFVLGSSSGPSVSIVKSVGKTPSSTSVLSSTSTLASTYAYSRWGCGCRGGIVTPLHNPPPPIRHPQPLPLPRLRFSTLTSTSTLTLTLTSTSTFPLSTLASTSTCLFPVLTLVLLSLWR